MNDMAVKKYKVLALFGKSGVGKDAILNWIVSEYPAIFHKIVSCTTRPKRDYEVEGVDYFFLSHLDFIKRVYNGDMLETVFFNDWAYGTSISALDKDKINIAILNPEGIRMLMEDNRIDLRIVYIDCPDRIRLIRALTRQQDIDCGELCRRYFADEKDFADLTDIDFITYINDKEPDDWKQFFKILFSKTDGLIRDWTE